MCILCGFLRGPRGPFHLLSPAVTCGGVPFEYHEEAEGSSDHTKQAPNALPHLEIPRHHFGLQLVLSETLAVVPGVLAVILQLLIRVIRWDIRATGELMFALCMTSWVNTVPRK